MGRGEALSLNIPSEYDLARLSGLLPAGRVFSSREQLELYSADESTRARELPYAVVVPESREEIPLILAWANEGGFALVTRGAGTGVAGGSVAVGGGVVLSLHRLNRIIEIDEENFTATVEPGVITDELKRAVEELGLFYPPDPASSSSCSIGGNVAVGAGGPRAVKYGTTRDYLLGAEVVLADGEVLILGGKNVKDASGYHLLELVVGSEGTLGVVGSVTVRLLPKPARVSSLLAPFGSLAGAARAVASVMRSGLMPAMAEFMDEVAIEASSSFLGRELPHQGVAGAFVFLAFDGMGGAELSEALAKAGEKCADMGALTVLAAEDEGQQARLWESRRVLGDAMKKLSPVIGKADVVVPRAQVPALVEKVKGSAKAHGIRIACFGHAGDGNVHVNILKEGLDDERWLNLLPKVQAELMAAVKELGGRPSGEHGIGFLRRGDLHPFVGDRAHGLMREIKAVFDPRGILNPGKVL